MYVARKKIRHPPVKASRKFVTHYFASSRTGDDETRMTERESRSFDMIRDILSGSRGLETRFKVTNLHLAMLPDHVPQKGLAPSADYFLQPYSFRRRAPTMAQPAQ